MIDPAEEDSPRWVELLRQLSRASGHELRNALNALVVNLEVVRSRGDSLDPSVQPFLAQAVDQSEESVRLAEGMLALVDLVLRSVGADGQLRIRDDAPNAIAVESTDAEAPRAVHALQSIARRGVFTAERQDAAVILRISDTARETKE